MPAGRPTKYDPKYCQEIKDFMADGGSVTEFAVHIGVSKATIYNWADDHSEFLDALTCAQEIGQAYWEKRLRTDLMISRDANAPLVKLYFANRFKWSDKTEVDNKSSDGSMTPKPGLDLSNLSDAAIAELMSARSKPTSD